VVSQSAPTAPGMHNIVIEHRQSGYVSHDSVIFDGFVNLTDNSTIEHTAPLAINAPIAGAGATTVIEGRLVLANQPIEEIVNMPNQTVWMTYTSAVDGAQNFSAQTDASGAWTITLNLSETEPRGNLSATLGFSGWQDTSVAGATPSTFHLNPSTASIVLNVTDAPNLTATIEGPLSNQSILVLGDDVWINGSALSISATPTALAGDLQFSIRANGSGDLWYEVFNLSVNGTFSIQHLMATNVMVAAGEIETRLRFFPATLPATDDADISTTFPYFLRGLLNFVVEDSAQIRGQGALVVIQINDHRGLLTGAPNTLGNYDISASTVRGSTPRSIPTLDLMEIAWSSFDANLPCRRLPNRVFPSTVRTFYQPSSGIRFDACAWPKSDGISQFAQDWTFMGNSTRLFGDLFDSVYLTPVINNTTLISVSLFTERRAGIDVAPSHVEQLHGCL